MKILRSLLKYYPVTCLFAVSLIASTVCSLLLISSGLSSMFTDICIVWAWFFFIGTLIAFAGESGKRIHGRKVG